MSGTVSLPKQPPDVEAYDLAIPPIREVGARQRPSAGNGAMSEVAERHQPPQTIDPMMTALERLARDPTIPTDRIVALYEMMKERELVVMERQFQQAMNAFQAKITQIPKNKENDYIHSWYATEEQIDRIARPIYNEFGLSISYGTKPARKPEDVCVVCYVSHTGGYCREIELSGPVSSEGAKGGKTVTTGIQAVGVATTYLRRILIRLALNLVATDNPLDNDGNRPASAAALASMRGAFAGIGIEVAVLEAMRAKAFETFTAADLGALRLVYGAMKKDPGAKDGGDPSKVQGGAGEAGNPEANADPFLRAAAGQAASATGGGVRPGETLTEDGEIIPRGDGGEPPFEVKPPGEHDPGATAPPAREA